MWTKRLGRVCAAGCGIVLIAGCSSSSSTTTGSSRPTASTAPTPAPRSELHKIVLQTTDLPAGWKGTPYQPDPTDAADQATLVKCVGGRDTSSDAVGDVNSDDFTLGDATVSSSATSYWKQSDLDADLAIAHSPKLSSCYDQLAKKQLASSMPAGAAVESVSMKITPGSAGGPANVIATGAGTIKVNVNGQHVAVYATVAFITGPLIEAEVDTENVGAPLSASLVQSLVAKVATRAAKG